MIVLGHLVSTIKELTNGNLSMWEPAYPGQSKTPGNEIVKDCLAAVLPQDNPRPDPCRQRPGTRVLQQDHNNRWTFD